MGLARYVEIKRVNAKRRAERFDVAYESPARAKWIAMQCSVVSGEWPCVNAHVRSRAAGGTAADIVPLTDEEHRELHALGIRSFEAKYNVNLTALAEVTDRRWRERTGEWPPAS